VSPRFWTIAGGLALGVSGAALIALYTRVNGASRRKGPAAHWRAGWTLALAGMSAMGAGWALLCLAGPHLRLGPLRLAGAALAACALAIYAASARRVGRWRSPSRYSLGLSTRGIYRRVRHPQALSLVLLSPGIGLLSGSLPYLLTVPLWVGFWTAYTFLEEHNELIPAFGEEYLRYREEVPRLIPRLRARSVTGA
jgi:protein-S-isoprenylcysteine O-methyltransferase Ste14